MVWCRRVVATSTYEFNNWPLIDLDLNLERLNSVSTAPCGLDSDGGTWTTEELEKPPAQNGVGYTLNTLMKKTDCHDRIPRQSRCMGNDSRRNKTSC